MAKPARPDMTAAWAVLIAVTGLVAGWWLHATEPAADLERRRPCGPPRSHVHTIHPPFDQETDHA